MKTAYIKANFAKAAIDNFTILVEGKLDKTFLYKSPVINYINGIVTENLHLTLFFGLKPLEVSNPELFDFIEESNISEISLGEIATFEGYKGLYKVLVMKVIDLDGNLNQFYNNVQDRFEVDKEVMNSSFKPHLTLAYVKNEFELKNFEIHLPKSLRVNSITTHVLGE